MAKIMVVDDSLVMRKILAKTLTDANHEIIAEAENGEEALSLLESLTPDIITLDITMPVMDGLEALSLIKEKYPDIKVVMVSAAGQKNKVMQAIKNGASNFLQKPFEPEDIISVISKLN